MDTHTQAPKYPKTGGSAIISANPLSRNDYSINIQVRRIEVVVLQHYQHQQRVFRFVRAQQRPPILSYI